MIRSADDFDAIRARKEAIRAEEIRARAEAAAQREKEERAQTPVLVVAAPAIAPEHVMVGWEEPAGADGGAAMAGLRPIGEILADVAFDNGMWCKGNPSLEVFARLRGYLDDCGAGAVGTGCVEDTPNGPTFRGIPIRVLPSPPDLGKS